MFHLQGTYVTQRFEDVAIDAYNIPFYLLPSYVQKDFPLFIAMAQKGIFLRGYAGTKCTCEVFMQVIIKS